MLKEAGLGSLVPEFTGGDSGEVQHYYPAFGGNPHRTIPNLIIPGARGVRTVDATWWFDCEEDDDTLAIGKLTTFNARNLESRYWKGAVKHSRGLVVATGLGESKYIDGKKHQFLMEGETPFFMGALYREFSNGLFSCAVITRDSHPRFDPYHDKAFPLFIPGDKEFVQSWLFEQDGVPDIVAHYLEEPKITVPLRVQEVSAFKRGRTSEKSTILEADS